MFDDYGVTFIYVFAGFFGLFVSVFNPSKDKNSNQSDKMNSSSSFIALIGTGFVFATFPFTTVGININQLAATTVGTVTTILPAQTELARRLSSNLGPLNIYFAMSASVICTYIFSALFGKGKVGIKEALIGTISGGIAISAIAGIITNIGACIAIGAFSGLVSGFWMSVIHPRINSNKTYDSLGLFGPILFNAIIGSMAVAPIVVAAYI